VISSPIRRGRGQRRLLRPQDGAQHDVPAASRVHRRDVHEDPEGDENRRTQLDDAIEKGRQLQQKYEKLARELKKNPEMDWKKEKEIQNALEKQKQVAEQVQKIAEDLQKEVSKMQDQQLVSADIAQKMEEIRKLMEQVQDETLRQYMERLQEAMKQISPEEIQRAMEKMQGSQEEFVKRLERTKALLEQFEARAGARSDDRTRLRAPEATRAAGREDRAARRQGRREAEGRQAEPGLEERDGQNQDQKDKPQSDPARRPTEGSRRQDRSAAEGSRRAGEGAEPGRPAAAGPGERADAAGESFAGDVRGVEAAAAGAAARRAPHQQNAEKSLRGLYEQLMEAQQSMSMSAQAEAGEKLAKAARQTLDVSMRQEDVTKQAPPQPDPKLNGELAEQQQALMAAAGRVVNDLDELGKQSLAAPGQVTALLGEAMNRMQEGVRAYEKGNPLAGRIQGEEAYGLLNRAVVELNRSASSSCQKPGNGSGTPKQMEDMMGQQQQLNDATRQFKQRLQNPQNMTPEERAEMSRLLGEQQSIQSQLQDIERKARESRELLGRLDKMQDEMHEVVQDMQSESLDDETLRVQEKIVSRMLDAQRSLHKRDYKEERESRYRRRHLQPGWQAGHRERTRQEAAARHRPGAARGNAGRIRGPGARILPGHLRGPGHDPEPPAPVP
jgi:DNA-binding transcriptional regulator YiaG